jgi:hypothetical protein
MSLIKGICIYNRCGMNADFIMKKPHYRLITDTITLSSLKKEITGVNGHRQNANISLLK